MQRQFRSDDTYGWNHGFGDGSDGDLTISANTTDSPTATTFSGSSGASTGIVGSNSGFSIGKPVLIYQTNNGGDGAGNWELNFINGISGTTFTFESPLSHNYDTSAQIIQLKQYGNVTVNSGKNWTAGSWDGSKGGILAFLATGTVTVTGSIVNNGVNGVTVPPGDSGGGSFTGGGFRGGRSATSPTSNSTCGEGTGGGNRTGTSSTGGNGGGGIQDNAGAGGGYGTSGGNAQSNNGGSTFGSADLTTMIFGGGGGSGSGGNGGGNGGGGGGTIFIIAKIITITGSIVCNGGNGGSPSGGRGGGGGAGGSILIKGQSVTLGSSLASAGGGSNGTGPEANGASGGSGRIHVDYAFSLSGTTSPALDSRQDTSLQSPILGGMF